MQQKGNRSTVTQLLSQIQEVQDTVNSVNDEKEFSDPETASCIGMSHVPSQPSIFPSPRGMISRDSCVPHHTLNSMGTSGNVFEDLPAPEWPSPSFFVDPNLASSSCELRPGSTGNTMRHGEGSKRERRVQQYRLFDLPGIIRPGILCIALEELIQNCMMNVPKYSISELIAFRKFPDSGDFQCRRVNFKTEVCVSTPFPQLTTSRINEVEMTRSIDNLMTSQSLEGKSFPDFEILDARIASALRRSSPIPLSGEESVLKSSELISTTDS